MLPQSFFSDAVMGNSPSSEQKPRKAPQKLSKPRVGNLASNGIDKLNAVRSNTSVNRQYTNSYNVGAIPRSPNIAAKTPEEVINGAPDLLEPAEKVDVDDGPLSRSSKRLSGLLRSVSSKSQPERMNRSQSNLSTAPHTFNGVVRPKSLVQHGVKPLTPMSLTPTSPMRPLSSQDPQHVDQKATKQELENTVKHEDADKSPTLAPTWPLAHQVDVLELRKSPSLEPLQDHSPDLPPVRTYSEPSLFAPTRRSSFGQTPGAATRVGQLEDEVTARSSFRKSMPLGPNSVHHSLPSGLEKRRRSMPAPSLVTEPLNRPHTPSDSEYMQLGGMKFGSLRITNADAVSKTKNVEHSSVEKSRAKDNGIPESSNPNPEKNAENLGLAVQPGNLAADSPSDSRIEIVDTEVDATTAQIPAIGFTLEPTRSEDEVSSRRESELTGGSENSDESSAVQDSSVEEPVPSLGSASSSTDGEPTLGVKREHSLRARGSAILTSIWPRKSLDSGVTRSSASSTHSRTASLPDARTDEDGVETTSQSQTSDGRGGQPNKLKRLLKSKRRSLPPDATYIVQDNTPMPIDAEDKLREHGFKVAGVPAERHTLRMEQSKDTLKTILSVGSAEYLPEDDKKPPEHDTTRRARSKSSNSEQLSPKPSNMNRTTSLLYPKPSSSQRRATLRKSLPMVVKPSSVKGDDDIDLGETVQIWGYEADMSSIASIRHMAGNSAFDQAFVPMSRDYDDYHHAPVKAPPPRHARPAHNSRSGWNHHPLRSRSSAPDFLETVCEPASPGGIDSTQQKPPKTPPPISLRTRGSKKSRRRSRSQHHSYRPRPNYNPVMSTHHDMSGFINDPEADSSFPRNLSQSLRSFPVQPPQGHYTNTHGGSRNVYDRTQFHLPRNHSQRNSWTGGSHAGSQGHHRLGSGPYHHNDPTSRNHHSHNAFADHGAPIRIS